MSETGARDGEPLVGAATDRNGVGDVGAIVEQVLAACGTGRVLAVGTARGELLRTLLRYGADAYEIVVGSVAARAADAGLPGRSFAGDLAALPFDDASFDIVVGLGCVEDFTEPETLQALRELHRVTRRSLYLRVSTRQARFVERTRAWWESRLLEIGFRKHVAYYQVNAYEAIGDAEEEATLLFENLAEPLRQRFPLQSLRRERDLHMDMLRETGARSDAHVVRYQLASGYVRPGDVVVDAACGLGYGALVLHQQTLASRTLGVDASSFAIDYATALYGSSAEGLAFRRGDLPDCLAELPDHSVDLFVAFETLEHVADPGRLIGAIARVLKPAGRLIASVPNDWSDASGYDPNPHHRHVYTWPRLRQELERHLLLEACFEQTASRRKIGRADCREWQDSGRRLRRVDASKLASGALPDCEWWIAVAMKDPAAGAAIKYEETSYPSCAGNADWNVTAFARDYVNPWLVKGMVTIGHRLSDDARLVDLAERSLARSPARSADAGAALCVMGYRFLAQQNLAAGTVEAFDRRCTRFLARGEVRNPHQRRWRISVLFVLAKLWQAVGRFDRAIARFHECAAEDPLEFSPLIATKSVEACLQLGLLHMALGERGLCEADLARGIRIAQRAAQNDWIHAAGSIERPVDFGLSELAVVVERASACAYALGRIEQAQRRPGQWWWQHRRDRITQLDRLGRLEADLIGKNRSAGEQSEQIRHLHRSLAAHIAVESSQATEIGRLHQVIAAKDAAVTQVGSEVSRLHAVVKAKDEAVAQVGAEVSRLHAVVKAKDEAVAQVGAEIARLHAVVKAKDEAVAQVGAEVSRLHAVVKAKDEAVAQVGAEIARLHAVVAAKDAAVTQLGVEVSRLHTVVAAKDVAVATVGAELARLHVAIAARDDANRALDEGIRRLNREAEDRQRTIGTLQGEVRELHGAVADRDAAAASLRVELERERAALASNLGDVRRVCDQLAGAGAAVKSHAEGLRWIEAIAAERAAQLAAIRDSRWFQLGEVLKRRSLGRTEIAFVLRLVSAMLRARIGRAFRKDTRGGPVSPRPIDAEGDGPALTSYAIQLPEPVAGPRVHVVHVLANFMTGGSSRLVVDLIERLGGRYRHRVVTSFVPTPLAYVGAEVGVIGIEASDETICKCLAQGNPDLVHIYYWGDCDEPWYRRILDAAERLGCPIIENVNTPVHPLRSPRIARYVYVSKYVQQTFGDASHVEEVIYPGSDLALFAPRSPPEDDANTIGMVYRLERDKLNEEAIDPLIRALQLRPRTRAVVVGGGTLLDIFQRKVAAAGLDARFRFTGYVAYEELPGLVAGMTLFVAPVWKESFGQVSTFAMSMGVPVVGYSAGAIPEIVDDPALLAEPGDSEGLARIIVRMLNEPALRAAASARCRKQAAGHSVETMVRRYEQLYGTLVRLPA